MTDKTPRATSVISKGSNVWAIFEIYALDVIFGSWHALK